MSLSFCQHLTTDRPTSAPVHKTDSKADACAAVCQSSGCSETVTAAVTV